MVQGEKGPARLIGFLDRSATSFHEFWEAYVEEAGDLLIVKNNYLQRQ